MTTTRDEAPLEPEAALELITSLLSLPVDDQLAAFERVIHVPDPEVRRRAVGIGAAILSDDRLIEFLRDDADDVRRNAGLEMLKLRRQRALKLAVFLLQDPDPDVALQAVLVLEHLGDLRSLAPLRSLLTHADVNVVQQTVIALGKLGHPQALPDLVPLLRADSWVASAAVEAVGRLGTSAAIPHLMPLLGDPLLGPFVGEALARIGGSQSFEVLARHWLARHADMDTALTLRRLAYMLENLTREAPEVPGLEKALEARTQSEDPAIREPAMRCLLALRGRDHLFSF